MPRFPGFVSGSSQPASYRADNERTVNLYAEIIESKNGPNAGYLRRRPGLLAFAASVITPAQAPYLLVGGGGGGAGDGTNVSGGGGGGGGQVLLGTSALSVQVYPVVVGTGGAGGASNGSSGIASTWNGLTANPGLGGGGGGVDGVSGTGCGGGGGADDSTTFGTGGIGTVSNGGTGGSNGGGGGGGSTGSGVSSPGFNTGGNGGPGVFSAIDGTNTGYGGGGGGGAYATPGTNDYGGGTGAILTGVGGNGTANTGGGGGGARFGFDGGDGADGRFVISYLSSALTATGGTITTVGSQTVHTFTASGNFEVTDLQSTTGDTYALAIHYCPAQGRTFFVTTSGLLVELYEDASMVVRGTIGMNASLAPVMADNGVGHQLIIVSNFTLHLLDLDTNGLSVISSNVTANPVLCDYSDGYFLLLSSTGVLQWSAELDGTTWDALDIAENSATSDPWTSLLVSHRELWLIGSASGQVWVDGGDVDLPFELVQGSIFHQGLIAPYTLQRCDNSEFWVGRNEQGKCVVFRASGYTPQRISTYPVELALNESQVPETARAVVIQSQGHLFYVIYLSDLQTSWVYDVSTEMWTEWALLADDSADPWVWSPWPVTQSVFAFGKNLVVGSPTYLVAQLAWDS